MSSSDINDSRFVLSVDKNDLILYAKIDDDDDANRKKYVCIDCVKQETKRTKRLVYALKTKANLTIKLKIDDTDMSKIKLSVKHPLYEDDTYILRDESIYNKPVYNKPDYDKPDYDKPDYDKPDYDKPDYDNPTDSDKSNLNTRKDNEKSKKKMIKRFLYLTSTFSN